MNVAEMMERVNSVEPSRVIAYIRDAFNEMAGQGFTTPAVTKTDIAVGRILYPLPSGADRVTGISVLLEENTTELISETEDRDFSGTTNWTNGDFASFDTTNDLSVTADSADQYCYLDQDDIITVNRRYRFEYDATITSGTFELQEKTLGTTIGSLTSGTDNKLEFTAAATDQIMIVCTSATGQADFDNLSLKQMSLDRYRPATRIIGDLADNYYDEETIG